MDVQESESLRVAVLEDEPALRERIILPGLARYGFLATGYASVAAFRAGMEKQPADLLVLDVSLPDGDGFSLAREMRQRQPGLGVIMLTSLADVSDRIRGLTEGADVYFPSRSRSICWRRHCTAWHDGSPRRQQRTGHCPAGG